MVSKTDASVHELKITLEDVKPAVWRRFAVKWTARFVPITPCGVVLISAEGGRRTKG